MAFKMRSPFRHAPYAAAHTKAEGRVAHQNTAEAHGKNTEDYYDGSKGKTTGNNWDSSGKKNKTKTKPKR
jgi:hypothetical protein